MMLKRNSCQTSEPTTATAAITNIVRADSRRTAPKTRVFRPAAKAGNDATTRAPKTTKGFARSAPSRSAWPMCTAAVVPPQMGHGIPVKARSGHTVAGRPGIVRCASATAPSAPTATRRALNSRPGCAANDDSGAPTASSATASPSFAVDVSGPASGIRGVSTRNRHHPDALGSGQGTPPCERAAISAETSRVRRHPDGCAGSGPAGSRLPAWNP